MGLPVEAVLGEVRAALAQHGGAVLQAPPGAGKTTRVPLDLLQHGLAGRLVLLEPRRVAARAAARRLADQLGEPLGRRVGLTTRDERNTSAETRIEVVTEGVLLRRLQRDPTLPGVGTVFFDEFHERNLEADLALALVAEVRGALREDLRVLVASATLDGERVAAMLSRAWGRPAAQVPIVTAEGRAHPVTVEHRDRPGPRELIGAVAATVREAVADADGDVLVFLPGAGEIRRVARELGRVPPAEPTLVTPLHGSLPAGEQDRALAPAPAGTRKVVLATDLAESSLTIDGVTTVVDAGLAREPRFDAARGMSGLVTVPASRASAEQRAGRAGRTAPGRCIRLWPAREHPSRDAHPRAAITTDDLTSAALEVAVWGADVEELALLDPPPPATWATARRTLVELGALGTDGRVTGHGRRLAELPLHPRLGHLLLVGAAHGRGRLAAEVAAVLSDRDPLVTTPEHPCADLTARVVCLRGRRPPPGTRVRDGALRRARREAKRLSRWTDGDGAAVPDDDLPVEIGWLVATGWPERIAGRRDDRRGAFLLAGGRGASLPEGDLLAGEAWLAVAALDRGASEARIHLAAPLTTASLRAAVGDGIETVDEVVWRDGDVVARRRERLGALDLRSRPLADPDPGALLDALLDGLVESRLEVCSWTRETRQLQARVGLLHRQLGQPWPDLSDAALLEQVREIFGPFLLSARRRGDLEALDLPAGLRSRLPPGGGADLDRLAPTHLEVPSGSRIALDYTAGDRPVLAVRVQEVLGSAQTPRILGGRLPVLLHLLSPAQRPVQVTDDLAGFWERAYPQVRAELRGRYPKHSWPEDPATAEPTRSTRRRRRD